MKDTALALVELALHDKVTHCFECGATVLVSGDYMADVSTVLMN